MEILSTSAPRGGWRQNAKERLSRPGYFWLAYDWDNLFYSCQLCNQRFKESRFPLENPKQRATPTSPNISTEAPLLIRPDEAPQPHIDFVAQVPRGLSKRGRKTIQVLGLHRDELNERRMRVLRDLAGYYHIFKDLNDKTDRTSAEAKR